MNEKKMIRSNIRQKLSAISKPDYEHYSYIIAQTLFQDEYWENAKTIGLTISRPPEVDTFQIIRKAWEEGKKVFIPKCFPKTRKMTFRSFTAFNQMESVFFGLWEPIEKVTEEIRHEQIDLVIVPGLAFTSKGYRIGFGGGYYDRFLQDYNGKTISLAFHFQLMDTLPIEKHDIPVEKIITDEGTVQIVY